MTLSEPQKRVLRRLVTHKGETTFTLSETHSATLRALERKGWITFKREGLCCKYGQTIFGYFVTLTFQGELEIHNLDLTPPANEPISSFDWN